MSEKQTLTRQNLLENGYDGYKHRVLKDTSDKYFTCFEYFDFEEMLLIQIIKWKDSNKETLQFHRVFINYENQVDFNSIKNVPLWQLNDCIRQYLEMTR